MESRAIITERQVVIEVLELYKKLPYMWNPTHKLYSIKNARQQGLRLLLEIWRQLEPKATVDCMKKKLNNWRAAYRRERLKIERSKEVATEPDEIHKPSLWYYDLLTFIHDDCPILSNDSQDDESFEISNFDEPHHKSDEPDHKDIERVDNGDQMSGDGNDNNDDCNDGNEDPQEEDEEEIKEPVKKPKISKKRKASRKRFKQEQLDTIAQVTVHSGPEGSENSAYLYGRAIGAQLQDLTGFQRCLAEKLISDVMFYGKLEQLTIGTSINLDS